VLFPIQPEKVYVVGAAGWWLRQWRVTDHDREVRVFAAIHRKYQKRIERERQIIAKLCDSMEYELVN
jgi:hypothetical protein